jgi:putative intracellular protease/amidase
VTSKTSTCIARFVITARPPVAAVCHGPAALARKLAARAG